MALISDQEYGFLRRLAAHLWDDLRSPIQQTTYSTHRLVYVLGCIRVRIEDRRHRITVKGLSWPNREWQGGAGLMLEAGFRTQHFLHAWISLQMGRSDRYGEAQRRLLEDKLCALRMCRALYRFARSRPEFPRFKAEVRRVCFADPEVRRLTLQMKCHQQPTHEHYLFASKHFAALSRLRAEKPELFPLLSVINNRSFDVETLLTEGYALVKEALLDAGLRPMAWRMMARHGERFWRPLRGTYEFQDMTVETLVMYGDLLAFCARPVLPPPELARAWADLGSLITTDKLRNRRFWPVFRAAWRECDRLMDKKQRRDFIRNEVAPVLRDWVALVRAEAPVTLGVLKSNLSWKSVRRRLERYSTLCHAETLSDTPWPAPDPALTVRGYEFAPVKHQREAFLVGLALRNCFTCAPRHESPLVGQLRHVVIRRVGKPVALLCLNPGDSDTIRQLKGPCNASVSDELLGIVLEYIEAIKAARKSPEKNKDAIRWSRRAQLKAAA